MNTLSLATLDRLDPGCRPLVDPRALRPRIVHFGLGAFHRAHQAVYTEQAAAHTGEPWGIAAVAPRSADTVAALRAQDGLYSVADLAPDAGGVRVVGSVVEAHRMQAPRVDILLTAAETTVVTLTVTEKGYSRTATGALDTAAVAPDLAATADSEPTMTTVIGELAASLVARFRANGAPISVVSCDNTAGNGAALARVVREFVEASAWPDRAAALDWLACSVGFPDTIVDRIVPATTPRDLDRAASVLGVRDAMAVVGEPYRQWVLADAFVADRPQWERGGALVVPDVTPYQLMKLRLLNGAHSALAYLGAAAGCTTVADVLATAWGERLVRALGAEVIPTLPVTGADEGPDPARYLDDLVHRFANPAVHHYLRQIGSDGSLKITERWFPALRALRAARAATPALELSVAAWVNATQPDAAFGMTDPAADDLARCWRTREVVPTLLRHVGAADLAEDTAFTTAVARRLPALRAGHIEL